MRSTVELQKSVTHNGPPGCDVMPSVPDTEPAPPMQNPTGTGNCATVPCGVICPMPVLNSLNHRFPSDPAAMNRGWDPPFRLNVFSSVPEVLTCRIWSKPKLASHKSPPGTNVIPPRLETRVVTSNSVIVPLAVSTVPSRFPWRMNSRNQSLLSGPVVMSLAKLPEGIGISLIIGLGCKVIFPMLVP